MNRQTYGTNSRGNDGSLSELDCAARSSQVPRTSGKPRGLGFRLTGILPATRLALIVTASSGVLGSACVRRTLTITTDPPQALVFLNDQEIGRSPVNTDFVWYGDYDVIIRQEGFETLKTNWQVDPPWYQVIPIDFFAEVLWPGHWHDRHERHFTMNPARPPAPNELMGRAAETREQALDPRK